MTVVIAGAGPTGLTLGIELARRGIPCRLLEREESLFPGSRGKGLQPRTLEVFDDLGVLDTIREGGMPFPKFRMYAGTEIVWERALHEMLGIEEPQVSPDVPYPLPWLIPQWRTDSILRDRFEELGGRIEYNCEVLDVDQDEDVRITVRRNGVDEVITGDYLVGTDGGRSAVRKLIGVGFEGETYERERTLVGDVKADGLAGVACHMITNAGDVTKRFSLWNLPNSDYYQLVASVTPEDAENPTLETVQRLLETRTGRTDITLHDLRWISVYRINVRMVSRFRTGRVLLAGDAAHVHSSASGQGLNTSVQDAYNLGWKLAAVLRGAPDELLDSYEAERLPVAAQVLGLSSAMHERNFRPTTGPAPAIHQLDITHRGGPLAIDDRERPGALRAGDRAPDGSLPDGTRLFDLFRGPHLTWLTIGDAFEGYDVAAGTHVLVRPDGYIAVISPTAAVVEEWLALFGIDAVRRHVVTAMQPQG
ncbi:FAD-dependent monooxygenase [Kutzneria buriramensis]|uniref:2-polyprenyl-6-methoxyphenol hydroxylase-like FAD-dependent oxidoreductase n=1 Tax=Kutzneria buriramensis TaxID=1045776 RepID=A0A3E0HM99_9PSEU|nr:FAD-dependent monooxygenase [Kutzneria buriramensis]REH47155.1 2-polyprenyl-6-methoxyphenol hydroxylase-like FAD-dependent oxidoreductase [Kutzneria buriramensis]